MVNISRVGAITNLPEFLLRYRTYKSQITSRNGLAQMRYADHIRIKQLAFFNIIPSPIEMLLHLDLMTENPISKNNLIIVEEWVKKLIKKNIEIKLYQNQYLEDFLYYYLELAREKSF